MPEQNNDRIHSLVEEMAEEYRADTNGRLEKISTALSELEQARSLDNDAYSRIKLHAHSIKGTSSTFGFHGLSVIAHTADDFLDNGPQQDSSAFLADLRRLTELMAEVISADGILDEEITTSMLGRMTFETGYVAGAPNNGLAESEPTAMLVLPDKEGREELASLLNVLGIVSVSARDGVHAIELASHYETSAIITVLLGDDMTAPELARVFSEVRATASIPVIVLIPHMNEETTTSERQAVSLLIDGLPPHVHTIHHDRDLARTLSGKLKELGILSA